MLQVHLQEVGMLNIPADHVKVKGLRYLVRPLNESHGPHIKWSQSLACVWSGLELLDVYKSKVMFHMRGYDNRHCYDEVKLLMQN